jgi:hypothetical protein
MAGRGGWLRGGGGAGREADVGVWSAVAEPANNEELRGVFEGLDTDGSGGLDRSEVRRPLRPFWRPF